MIQFGNNVKVDPFVTIFKESKSKSVPISDVTSAQTHLSSDQSTTLSTILNKHIPLFDSILKVNLHCHIF